MLNLYKTYKEVKNIFVKPQVFFQCGLWKNDPNLPVWRRGPILKFYKRRSLSWFGDDGKHQCYQVRDMVMVKGDEKTMQRADGSTYTITNRIPSHHKLPKGISSHSIVWASRVRKKLRKYHLGWIPTQITLPSFFAFHVYNWDLGWKMKWDEPCYEFPPQFTIVVFGISFSWTLHAPVGNDWDYWESILNYLLHRDLKIVDEYMGIAVNTNGEKRKRLSPQFLKNHEI